DRALPTAQTRRQRLSPSQNAMIINPMAFRRPRGAFSPWAEEAKVQKQCVPIPEWGITDSGEIVTPLENGEEDVLKERTAGMGTSSGYVLAIALGRVGRDRRDQAFGMTVLHRPFHKDIDRADRCFIVRIVQAAAHLHY